MNEFKDSVVNKQESSWLTYERLKINADFFEAGVILVEPEEVPKNWSSPVTHDSFQMKERVLTLTRTKKNDDVSNKKIPKDKAYKLMSKLGEFIDKQEEKTVNENTVNENTDNVTIINTHRREEIFRPLVFAQSQDNPQGMYVYPWLSDNKNLIDDFTGFEQYVTAGCLFGASLKGKDQLNNEFPIIKHDIKFWPAQKIVSILHEDKESAPYENMLFIQFEKICQLIDKFTPTNLPKKLFYHLPYYDYILFGLELYVQGRITCNALVDYSEKVLKKKDEHTRKIQETCKKYDIEVFIFSPFENMFSGLNSAEKILGMFNFFKSEESEIDPEKINRDQKEKTEKKLVNFCLEKLKNDSFNTAQQKTWKKFAPDNDHINNFEELFKVANALAVAVASKEKSAYKTCSILPLSEKQIQVGYAQYIKSMKNDSYPPTFNLTLLDSIVTYSGDEPNKNGLLFYFNDKCRSALSEYVTKNLMEKAYENVFLSSNNKKPNSLRKLIEDIKNPLKFTELVALPYCLEEKDKDKVINDLYSLFMAVMKIDPFSFLTQSNEIEYRELNKAGKFCVVPERILPKEEFTRKPESSYNPNFFNTINSGFQHQRSLSQPSVPTVYVNK